VEMWVLIKDLRWDDRLTVIVDTGRGQGFRTW
jgi:hypothetical protein